jgi:hypothetical protein
VEGFSALRNIFDGGVVKARSELPLSELFAVMPIAVLQAEGRGSPGI